MRLLSRGTSSSGRSGRSGAPTTSRAPRAVSMKAVRRRSSVRSTVFENVRAIRRLCHGGCVTPVAWLNETTAEDVAVSLSGLVAQQDAQQGTVNLQVAIVADEAQRPEFVHEMADPWSRGADDLGQCFLADRRGDVLRALFLAEVRQQEQRPGQPLFARVEELIDQVLLDAAVAGQQMGDEQLAERRFFMKDADHLGLADPRDLAVDHGPGRRQALRLADQASLAEKLSGA